MDLEPGFQSWGPWLFPDQPELSTASSLGSHETRTQWVFSREMNESGKGCFSPSFSKVLPVGISGGLPVRGGFVEREQLGDTEVEGIRLGWFHGV